MKTELTWSEAIEKFMFENGYFATLKKLHQEVPKLKKYAGLTPHKTINERVQRDPRFTKISPGLWALTKYLDKLPPNLNPRIPRSEEEKIQQTHSSIQGLLLEIGKSEGFNTYTPDKNSPYINGRLGNFATLEEMPKFTYEPVVKRVSTIDVIWFNKRGYPCNAIEVEHTTNYRNSLLKFLELQDFVTRMTIVSFQKRIREFEKEIKSVAFREIINRCVFFSYEQIEQIYSLQIKLSSAKIGLF